MLYWPPFVPVGSSSSSAADPHWTVQALFRVHRSSSRREEPVAAEEKARKRRQVDIDVAMATAKAHTVLKPMQRAEMQRSWV